MDMCYSTAIIMLSTHPSEILAHFYRNAHNSFGVYSFPIFRKEKKTETTPKSIKKIWINKHGYIHSKEYYTQHWKLVIYSRVTSNMDKNRTLSEKNAHHRRLQAASGVGACAISLATRLSSAKSRSLEKGQLCAGSSQACSGWGMSPQPPRGALGGN